MVDLHVRACGLIEAFEPWLRMCGALTNTLDPISLAKAQQSGAVGSIDTAAVASAGITAQSINDLTGQIVMHVFASLQRNHQGGGGKLVG
jgi:hypothetical protein